MKAKREHSNAFLKGTSKMAQQGKALATKPDGLFDPWRPTGSPLTPMCATWRMPLPQK